MTSLDKLTEIPYVTESHVDAFEEAGFEQLEDLVDLTEHDLDYIDGVGPSKLNQIYQLLDREGIERAEKDENYQKFRSLLEELFQFESADLDFGIYRIMNERRDRIEAFLNEELEEKVQEELEEFKNVEQGDAKEDLEDAKEEVKENFPQWTDENGDVDEDEIPEEAQGIAQEHKEKYLNAKKELQKAEIGEETEAAIYQDLYRFFKRYYKDGDFIPQRRAANQEKYAIPYNGEEVKLHWANKDQYFVKTGEHFKDYKFDKDSYEIEFKLHDAHVEKNNKKGDEKFFVLRDENPVEQDERFLTVHFEYRPLTEEDYEKYDLSESSQSSTYKKEIRKQTEEKILSKVSNELEETLDQEVENPRSESTVLQKHLKNYRTKNENDYFIHKDLGGFLEQELDFYLKNEVFSWKEMTDDNGEIPAHVRARLNAIENIAQEIIGFVAEIEDYQKKLFEKKKFVVNTEYCITLDKIPEELYPEILDNEEQIKEWKELYALEEQEDQGLEQFTGSAEIDEEFLKQNQSMMVDTKHFDEDFKYKVISSFSNLNDEVGGKVYKAENYQALSLLRSKYKEKIDHIYIDPPYNTKNNAIIYKNNYKHSSWLSLMNDRLSKSKDLLKDSGVLTTAIDENEQERLGLLFERLYADYKRDIVSVVHNPRGKQGDNFSYTHESAYFLYKDGEDAINPRIIPEEKRDFSNLRNWGGESKREFGNKSFYPIYVKDGKIEEIGEVPDEDFHPESRVEELEDNRFKVWPIDQNEVERKWRYAHDTLQDRLEFTKVEMSDNPQEIEIMISRPEETYKTVWSDSKFDAGSYGSKLLTSMGISEFTFPKSIHNVERAVEASKSGENSLIMDYFAGSGTTAHAVLEINKAKNENHEYIMVEMGDYFGTTLIPRIKKVVRSSNWNDGIPQKDDGMSHLFKYQKIEDYEDTLNNLDTGDDQTGVEEFTSDTLEYFLDFEVDGKSLLDLDGLKDPFNYEMKIREGDEAKRETIDLVETFNYLLGLEVEKIKRHEKLDREYRIVKGTKDEEEIVVVWRPVTDDPNDEFYEDEREFLKSEVLGGEDTVYINHDSALEAKPIEKTFRSEMWQD